MYVIVHKMTPSREGDSVKISYGVLVQDWSIEHGAYRGDMLVALCIASPLSLVEAPFYPDNLSYTSRRSGVNREWMKYS